MLHNHFNFEDYALLYDYDHCKSYNSFDEQTIICYTISKIHNQTIFIFCNFEECSFYSRYNILSKWLKQWHCQSRNDFHYVNVYICIHM